MCSREGELCLAKHTHSRLRWREWAPKSSSAWYSLLRRRRHYSSCLVSILQSESRNFTCWITLLRSSRRPQVIESCVRVPSHEAVKSKLSLEWTTFFGPPFNDLPKSSLTFLWFEGKTNEWLIRDEIWSLDWGSNFFRAALSSLSHALTLIRCF